MVPRQNLEDRHRSEFALQYKTPEPEATSPICMRHQKHLTTDLSCAGHGT